MAQEFKIHIPFEVLEKSQSDRLIGGICSTEDLDLQQERLLQDGLDFGPFLQHGWFNDNHSKDTGAAVGEPTLAELREFSNGRKAWYVEGRMFETPRATEIFSLAKSLSRPGSKRRLGFSVEGAVVERDPEDPRTVRKAIVREIAITRCPVNTSTELQVLTKALAVGDQGAVLTREALEKRPKKDDEDEDDEETKKSVTATEAEAWFRSMNVPEPLVPVAVAMAIQNTQERTNAQ